MRSITTKVLLDTLAKVGMPLQRCKPGEGNLYIWTSDQAALNGYPVYIGSSLDKGKQRVNKEKGWVTGFDREALLDARRSVIATTLTAHNAKAVELWWDEESFDETAACAAIDRTRLSGWPVQNLREVMDGIWTPSALGMEHIIIRAALHTGTLIANSAMTGQWESQVGVPYDTLGRLVAVDSGHLDELLPSAD